MNFSVADNESFRKQVEDKDGEQCFMRVNSDVMKLAGISKGDVVVINRKQHAIAGKVVVAVLDGELLIRRIEISGSRRSLVPASSSLATIDVSDASHFSVWGVVTHVIHSI